MNPSEKWMMIVNPASASATKKEELEESMKRLADGGLTIESVSTEFPGHAIRLAQESAEKGFRRFIAVGGDGTIHEVMTGLLRFADATGANLGDFTLAVLPYGTGNDWIKTSQVPKDLPEATRCILAGHTALQDVVRVTFDNGVYCLVNVGGIGLDANICYNTNTLKKKGRKGEFLYKMVAPYSIITKSRYPVEIVCDGKPFYTGKLFTAVIGNGSYRGGGIHQTEDGTWDDGLLEVSIMGGVSHIKAVSLMVHALKGDFPRQKGILSAHFRKMTVKPLGKPHRIELDGEIPGVLPATFETTGQQIRIIVP